MTSAFTSLSHPRKTQAEAGQASLCVIFDKLVQSADDEHQTTTLSFVFDIVERLDEQLRILEWDLATGIEEHAIHGYLAAVR